jgi:hypothetical protein
MIYLQKSPQCGNVSATATISRKKVAPLGRWVRPKLFRGPTCISLSSERQSPRSVTPPAAPTMSTPPGSGEADGAAPTASTYYDVYGPDVRDFFPSLFFLFFGEGKLRFLCFRVVEPGKFLITWNCINLSLGKAVFSVFCFCFCFSLTSLMENTYCTKWCFPAGGSVQKLLISLRGKCNSTGVLEF